MSMENFKEYIYISFTTSCSTDRKKASLSHTHTNIPKEV